ncbi:nuclease [Alkalihalophilus pseudofirmus]|nr:nuclease [Alkalihalophilus pseudofirmus]
MLLKKRSESHELMIMRYLNTRMKLNEKEKFRYLNLEKGYDGEVKFDKLTERLQEDRFILNDLILEVNNSYFQIDTLIISQGVIHLLDIKNHEGDCYLELDKLYSVKTGWEYKNPVNQLKRSETLFSQLLQSLKYTYLVKSSVIFINPEFTLYQAPMNQPIILPSQVTRFINDLNNTPSQLNARDKEFARKLISLHQPNNPFNGLPSYHYDLLQKGIYCNNCKSYLMSIKYHDFVCRSCGEHEKIRTSILRNVYEFQLLFPERRVTTKIIYEWCNTDLNEKTIRRVLKKNFTSIGNTRDTYYQ